jgi:hypothetical protein
MNQFNLIMTLYRDWEFSDGSTISFSFCSTDLAEWEFILDNSYDLVKQQNGGILPKGKELPARIYYDSTSKKNGEKN